jgi:hypothetical protein
LTVLDKGGFIAPHPGHRCEIDTDYDYAHEHEHETGHDVPSLESLVLVLSEAVLVIVIK